MASYVHLRVRCDQYIYDDYFLNIEDLYNVSFVDALNMATRAVNEVLSSKINSGVTIEVVESRRP